MKVKADFLAKINKLKKDEEAISATLPDEKIKKQFQEAKINAEAGIRERRELTIELESDNNLFEKTLSTINSGMCPLTNQICNEKMSDFADELKDKIVRNKNKIVKQHKIIKKLELTLLNIATQIKEYDKNAENYRQKVFLQNYIKDIEMTIPNVPEKPVDVEIINFAEEKKILKEKKMRAESFDTFCKNRERLMSLDKKYKIYDMLIKDFDITGCVYKSVVDKYLSILTEEVNLKAEVFKTGCSIIFENNHGITIRCRMGETEDYRSFDGLSAGERSVVLFLLTDLCNSLSGLNILILDDLDKLDENNLSSLLKLITSKEAIEAYDHIFLASVDHDDTVRIVNDMHIHIME